MSEQPTQQNPPATYADAGVDIDAGDKLVELIAHRVQQTHGPRVMHRHGAFAGLFRLDQNPQLFAKNFHRPVLVSATDGVGSKLQLALACQNLSGLGQDLVAMNTNDLLVQGAEPLFFLDYIGTHRVVDGSAVQSGDVVLGLASSGVHANGFTLVRAILDRAGLDPHQPQPELDANRSLGELLLEPTRLYGQSVLAALEAHPGAITGMAHITGGGLPGNLNRVLPRDLDALIDPQAWQTPPLFRFLQHHGCVEVGEMRRVFNLGIGYCLIVRPDAAEAVRHALESAGETVFVMGQITPGSGEVRYQA